MSELPFWQLTARTVAVVFLSDFRSQPTPGSAGQGLRARGAVCRVAAGEILGSFLLRIRAGNSPTFAIANVAVTADWFLMWVPPFMRRTNRSSTYEIAAPRDRVFAFVTAPANWPLYNPGVQAVSVEPPGPLAEGSRITFRQKVAYPGLRGPRLMMPDTLDITSVVTRLVPNEILATRRADLPDSSDLVELAAVERGTLVTGQGRNVLAYRCAVFGARISSWLNRRKVEALISQRQTRLKSLLEPPPT